MFHLWHWVQRFDTWAGEQDVRAHQIQSKAAAQYDPIIATIACKASSTQRDGAHHQYVKINNNAMEHEQKEVTTILAIDPTVRGFGYIVFDGIKSPEVWGKAEMRIQKNRRSLIKIKKLIEFHQPDAIVVEDPVNSLRHRRTSSLIMQIEKLAVKRGIKAHKYTRSQIQDVFTQFGAVTKYEIAKTISDWFPELALKLPEKRGLGWPEDERYGIFDAASLGLTYFYLEE